MARALASVFVLLWTAIAFAQAPAPNPQGAKLFEEGRQLAAAKKWVQACEKFALSLDLDPAIGTQLNLADCHENLGHNVQAWRLFDSAADAEKITNPTRAQFARGRADALLSKLGVIVLKVGSPEAPMLAVSIAGRTVKPAAVIKEIVEPGEVAIAVTAQNAPPFQKSEKVAAGKTLTITVPPFETTDGVSTPGTGGGIQVSPADETDDGGRRQRSRVLLAYGVGGAGALALVTGVVLGVKAKGDYNAQFEGSPPNCEDTPGQPTCNEVGFGAQNDALSLATTGTVFGVAGVVLLGAGAVLFFTAPKEVAVTPTLSATSGGISVVGRF